MQSFSDPPVRLRFGVFEADLRLGQLTRSGKRVRLQEQPFRVLALLLERPGELITHLGQISALRVISRTSAMSLKATTKSLTDIARELNVEAVVEVSVLRAGDRVRITAQLAPSSSRSARR